MIGCYCEDRFFPVIARSGSDEAISKPKSKGIGSYFEIATPFGLAMTKNCHDPRRADDRLLLRRPIFSGHCKERKRRKQSDTKCHSGEARSLSEIATLLTVARNDQRVRHCEEPC